MSTSGSWLCFLPLAGAPVCRDDVRALAAAAPSLGAPARPLVVVSVDAQDHLRRFLDEQCAYGGFDGRLLVAKSDPQLELARTFGVAHPGGFARRASFLLDGDGRVLRSQIHSLGFVRPVSELLGWLAELPAPA